MKTWTKTPSLKDMKMTPAETTGAEEIDQAVEDAWIEAEAERLIHEFGMEAAAAIAERLLDDIENDEKHTLQARSLYAKLSMKLNRKYFA